MKQRPLAIFAVLISAFCSIALSGCGDVPVDNAPAAVAQKVMPTKESVNTGAVENKEEQKPAFSYSPIGKRDPFESLLKKEKAIEADSAPKTPLENFDLGQFRIQAILIGKGAPRAMVSAPDGKNYILKPGLKIGKNNGVIKDINKSSIIVEESTLDYLGNLVKGSQTLSVPEQKSF